MKNKSAIEPQKYLIKQGETISWSPELDWLNQFTNNLQQYIENPRSKSRAHKKFAATLENKIKAFNKTGNAMQLVENEIIPLLREKPQLSQEGLFGQKSFLYALCEIGVTQFDNEKKWLKIRADLERELSINAGQQQQLLDNKNASILNAQGLFIAEQNKNSNLQQELSTIKDALTKAERLTTEVRTDLQQARLDILAKDSLINELEAKLKAAEAIKTTPPPPTPTPPKGSRQLKNQITQLEREKKQLQQENQRLTKEMNQLQQEKSRYQHIEKIYLVMKKFLAKLFDTSLLECFTTQLIEPSLTETQLRLMKSLAYAKSSNISTKLEADIEAAASKTNQEPELGLEDRLNKGINAGISFLSSLPQAFSKTNLFSSATETDTEKSHTLGNG